MDRKSILDMAQGAIKERIDYIMPSVIDNILDPNTRADKKRILTVTLEFLPDAKRQNIRVDTTAKPKLEPTDPISTSLYITGDENGLPIIVEMIPQIPGQTAMDGSEQTEPAVLRLMKNG